MSWHSTSWHVRPSLCLWLACTLAERRSVCAICDWLVVLRGRTTCTATVLALYCCCSYMYVVRPVDILLPAVISSFHCIYSRHVHVITCPPPNIVYPCCFSSPRKTFSFYFTLNCSQNHAITSSFPVAVLREFPMLNLL